MVPDVFQKCILASMTGREFLRSQDRVVDFAPQLPLKFSRGLREDFLTRSAYDEHVNVASGVLLVERKRTVQVCVVNSLNIL
jgi:hypothetical protein